jgi:hypothetical protein
MDKERERKKLSAIFQEPKQIMHKTSRKLFTRCLSLINFSLTQIPSTIGWPSNINVLAPNAAPIVWKKIAYK